MKELSRPYTLVPAGDDPAAVQPGGALTEEVSSRFDRPDAPAVVPFSRMLHGWMTRGPLEDEAIARDYAAGVGLALRLFEAHAV